MVQIEIEETFTAPGNRPDTRLIPLAEELARYDNPHTVLDYLRQKAGGKLIRKMVTGELDCSHEALDSLPQTNSVAHLRNLLVLTEVLPARDEQLAQFQLDIPDSRTYLTATTALRSSAMPAGSCCPWLTGRSISAAA
ncbi:hypothetical protein OG369_05175 [Streptomyces sp. NBC_01221]|uniref:hypothetical protein n=1 Tax=unclassified Streptomyces TaxID=2593676 RepID=UPI00224E5D78|nr:hypothetical protein [Streptomyces sp. NBC_01221]MCX4785584.1 hypothetical protein [Streptomyces sp. NBC_01221]WSP54083.1 hypothetical protein OG306_06570 [Streptomyces sp. NBC_01241]